MQRITIRSVSYPGKNKRNEDFLRYAILGSEESVVVLADGMGGLSYGELAAQTVVNAIFDTIVELRGYHSRLYSMDDIFHKAFREADAKLKIQCHEKHCKMGAAVTALFIAEDILYFMELGNVRLYRSTTDNLELLTQDHVLQRTSGQSHFLTQCVNGKGFRKIPTLEKIPLYKTEKFYLCSDGCFQTLTPNISTFNMEIPTTFSDFEDDYSVIEISINSTK